MIKSNSGNLSLKLFMLFAIILFAANAAYSDIPSCYPTMPWEGSAPRGWPGATSTTNISQSMTHNYIKTGTSRDNGQAYWTANQTSWITYATAILYNLTHDLAATINPPSGDPHWYTLFRMLTPADTF